MISSKLIPHSRTPRGANEGERKSGRGEVHERRGAQRESRGRATDGDGGAELRVTNRRRKVEKKGGAQQESEVSGLFPSHIVGTGKDSENLSVRTIRCDSSHIVGTKSAMTSAGGCSSDMVMSDEGSQIFDITDIWGADKMLQMIYCPKARALKEKRRREEQRRRKHERKAASSSSSSSSDNSIGTEKRPCNRFAVLESSSTEDEENAQETATKTASPKKALEPTKSPTTPIKATPPKATPPTTDDTAAKCNTPIIIDGQLLSKQLLDRIRREGIKIKQEPGYSSTSLKMQTKTDYTRVMEIL